MIVKKLYRKVECKYWDAKRKKFDHVTIDDYIGWFLFGIIPLYLIKIDSVFDTDGEEIRWGIYKEYGHCINGGKG